MHAGEIDQAEIDRWAASNSLVEAQQTVAMITVDGSTLYAAEPTLRITTSRRHPAGTFSG